MDKIHEGYQRLYNDERMLSSAPCSGKAVAFKHAQDALRLERSLLLLSELLRV